MIQPQPIGKVSEALVAELHELHPQWSVRLVNFLAAYMEAATNEGVMFPAGEMAYPHAHQLLKASMTLHFTSLPVRMVTLAESLYLRDADGLWYITGDRSTVGTPTAWLTTAKV